MCFKHLFSRGISRTFQSRGPQCAIKGQIKSQEIFTLQWLSAEENTVCTVLYTDHMVSVGLIRVIRRRHFPRKIALCKSLTQVRDRRLEFNKLNKSKNSWNLDILIPSKIDGFVVSSFWMEVIKVPIKSGECWLYCIILKEILYQNHIFCNFKALYFQ